MKNKSYILIWVWIIIVLLPVAYYFCYALPSHNKAMQEIELQKLEYQKRQDKIAEEKAIEEKREAERKEQEKQQEKERNYQNCMATAQENYNSTWNRNCKSMYDAQNNEYQKCVNDIQDYNRKYPQEAYPDNRCDNRKPTIKQTECSLPTATADYINKQFSEEKDRCLSLYKI